MKILIVDDQQLILLPLRKCLTDLGYEVMMAENVFDAIAAYEEFKPDMVITDINMPVLPGNEAASPTDINEKAAGLEIVKYIRTIKCSSMPILVLSGMAEEKIIRKGFEMGINEYMKKPLIFSTMAVAVKRLLNDTLRPAFGNPGLLL